MVFYIVLPRTLCFDFRTYSCNRVHSVCVSPSCIEDFVRDFEVCARLGFWCVNVCMSVLVWNILVCVCVKSVHVCVCVCTCEI